MSCVLPFTKKGKTEAYYTVEHMQAGAWTLWCYRNKSRLIISVVFPSREDAIVFGEQFLLHETLTIPLPKYPITL